MNDCMEIQGSDPGLHSHSASPIHERKLFCVSWSGPSQPNRFRSASPTVDPPSYLHFVREAEIKSGSGSGPPVCRPLPARLQPGPSSECEDWKQLGREALTNWEWLACKTPGERSRNNSVTGLMGWGVCLPP